MQSKSSFLAIPPNVEANSIDLRNILANYLFLLLTHVEHGSVYLKDNHVNFGPSGRASFSGDEIPVRLKFVNALVFGLKLGEPFVHFVDDPVYSEFNTWEGPFRMWVVSLWKYLWTFGFIACLYIC